MTKSKVFKARLEVTAKTVILDADTADEDGDNAKVLFNKTQINEIILKHFLQAMQDKLEELDQDDEIRDVIFDELMIDTADYDLSDIAEVRISF